MQKTDAQLSTYSTDNIASAVGAGSITKVIHDTFNQDFNDSKINNDKIDTANTLDTVGKTIAGRDALKNYIAAAVAALIGSAPGALDTLGELAEALADDADFAATITALVNTKLNKTAAQRAGTVIAFDVPATYGYAAAETTNITLNAAGLVEGTTQLLIHNNAGTPTFDANFKIIGGEYIISVPNYIMMHAVKNDLILVTISQEL
jgi:hypothetical protein